jgi:hypothetical protein
MLSHLWDAALRSSQPEVRPATEPPPPSLQNSLDAILKLIPAEVVGAYLALVGFFGQSWLLFWLGAVLIPIGLTLAHFEKRKAIVAGQVPPSLSKLVLAVIVAFVAYVPWTATLPGTPFLRFSTHATTIGAATAIVLSALLPRLARLLGIVA